MNKGLKLASSSFAATMAGSAGSLMNKGLKPGGGNHVALVVRVQPAP